MIREYINDLKKEFKGYNSDRFIKDLLSGITVCAVAIPLALAFGVSSGANAAAGLITAIIAGLVIGALSGASFQISGPTGAMSAILLPISMEFGLEGIFIICFISGILLLLAGVLKLGKIASYIPLPVITGFTSGIAVIIALGQLGNLFGVSLQGESVIHQLISFTSQIENINYSSLLIGVFVGVVMIITPKKINSKVPSSLIGIVLALIINAIFIFDVITIGTIPSSLVLENRLIFSNIDISTLGLYISPAITVAALGLIESLLCGASGGKMKGEKLNFNRELVAQGVGNIIIPFFGGVPATAAIARSSVAIKSGQQTRLTSIIHSLGLIASMLLLGKVMGNIPLSALSGVLMVTAFRMNDWTEIKTYFSKKYISAIILYLVTLITTVIFDLVIAIIIGVFVAFILYVIKTSSLQVNVKSLKDENSLNDFQIIELKGVLSFLTIEKINMKLETMANEKRIIFSFKDVYHVDIEELDTFREYLFTQKSKGCEIFFIGASEKLIKGFDRCEIFEIVGRENFYSDIKEIITIA